MRGLWSAPGPRRAAPKPVTLSGWGITADVPGDWEGRLFNRPTPTADFTGPSISSQQQRSGPDAEAGSFGWKGERTAPVLHLANFALGNQRGDFGSGVVDTMGPQHAFISLLEYGSDLAATPLFSPRGIPRPRRQEFSPDCLQRRLPGQLGYQRFFSVGSRALCLFVVLGSAGQAGALIEDVNAALDGVEVQP